MGEEEVRAEKCRRAASATFSVLGLLGADAETE